ncbi:MULTISPECIES: GTP 3',8-cyclase MoaA [Methylomonas]|uniref:GTP 3',8-cyclase MoaA n=1 Tax=Methylomonas TaxID=416 RepID=UPI001E52DCDA|nr:MULTISPECIES: GTP 3',8-cyclase MoaA [Methylomonas]
MTYLHTIHPNNSTASNLIDPQGRHLNYLRLAITDRCNFRCTYCMPEDGIDLKARDDIMRFQEMEHLLGLFLDLGVTKVRITGGEPFVRKGLPEFLIKINQYEKLESINLTTNAYFTEDAVQLFQKIKMDSINISLDSLNREVFYKITRRDDFEKVWSNIKKFLLTDLTVKLNMVVIKGINDNEIVDFAELAKNSKVEIRFIEQMPFNGGHFSNDILSAEEIILILQNAYPSMMEFFKMSSTARIFEIPGFKGRLGIIAGHSRTFCSTCSRLRLTPEGILKICLYDHGSVNLKDMLRSGRSDQEIKTAIKDAVSKRAKDGFESEQRTLQKIHFSKNKLSMAQIGG